MIMDSNNQQIIVVTGFGLFRNYKANPSWEAVKLLDENDLGVKLIKKEIPVAYDEVKQAVKEIWNTYRPMLVIHVGVSSIATGLTLEKRAVKNKERYCLPDVNARLPNIKRKSDATEPDGMHLTYLCTNLDVDRICEEINRQHQAGKLKLPGRISERAGEFLCEFIYRCSLKRDQQRTLFIHVPETSDKLTPDDIAQALRVAIKEALKQL